MELLPLHIEYLLTRHDCVIMPGIGAFIVSEKESSFDPESGAVSPRTREISFNSSVASDDGLLSHSIARREHLSYETAHRILMSIVEKIKADLSREGEVTLGLVGRLVRDEEGMVSFKPRHSHVFSDIYRSERLTRISAHAAAGQATDATEDTIARVSENGSVAEDGSRIICVAPDRYVFTIRKKVAHIAAMFAVLLTVGLSLLIPVNHVNEQKASVISFDEILRTFRSSKDSAPIDTPAPTDSITARHGNK